MSIAEGRPPYVAFDRRPVEDREASIANGYYTTRDVDFVTITPPGGKNDVQKPAVEWLEQIRQSSRSDSGRFPVEWVRAYEQSYEAWKAGEELPENGVPIKGWSLLSPSQQQACLHANLRTVEDLASATEEGLMAFGMGARALKQKAADWLAARGDGAGKVAAELEALRQRDKEREERVKQLEKQLAALSEAEKQAKQAGVQAK